MNDVQLSWKQAHLSLWKCWYNFPCAMNILGVTSATSMDDSWRKKEIKYKKMCTHTHTCIHITHAHTHTHTHARAHAHTHTKQHILYTTHVHFSHLQISLHIHKCHTTLQSLRQLNIHYHLQSPVPPGTHEENQNTCKYAS